MNDAPQIDDRRRYKELWKELVIARISIASLSSFFVAGVIGVQRYRSMPPPTSDWWYISEVVGASLAVSLPSLAAKLRAVTIPAVAGVTFMGLAPAWIAVVIYGVAPELGPPIVFAIIGMAVGTVEGLLERSMATTYVGLLGGGVLGIVCGGLYRAVTPIGAFVMLEVGIGLSLALGRWIRDLPKRKAQQFEGDGVGRAAP